MNNKLILLIMRHLTLLDSGEDASRKIFEAACRSDIDLVHFEMGNRDRVIKLIKLFQHNVEEYLNELPSKDLTGTTMELIKLWSNDLNRWVEKVEKIDMETSEILEGQKESTTREISTVFKNSENLKGYNLNNVTK